MEIIIVGFLFVQLVVIVSADPPLPAYRLPRDVIPHYYNLSILTNLEEFTFSGFVDIEIECKKSTDTIKLHSVALQIPVEGITLKRNEDAENVKISNTILDSTNNFLVIKTIEPLKTGSSYILHVPFGSKLIGSLIGYYRSSYWDSTSNSTKWMAVSHFEPTSARRAFPCFDEPAMKAKFRIHLGHKPHLRAISNMPLINTRSVDGWVWDEFQETLPMSTYLVAFVVSEFEYIQSIPQSSHVLFRVWTRKEALNQGEFAVTYGPKFLNFFEHFFGISFPLPKQDMVAIPDFDQGAMENWGLITYREGQFLLEQNTTAAPTKFAIANTIAHELAHQWFGNLVTMKWWTDLWLNEGFATFMAAVAMQHQFPEWNSYNFDIGTSIQRTFFLDGLKSSHPVSVTIGNPKELSQIFDSISYSKGSLLIHMMNSFLGEDVFRSGVSNYLKKFSYSNSEQDDLWASLTAAAEGRQVLPPGGVTVKDIMDTWTLQSGYPVIKVRREGGRLTASQERFLSVHQIGKYEGKECWWVPLTYSTAKRSSTGKAHNTMWLSCEQPSITFDTSDVTSDDWILVNHKTSGIFRVNYDEHNWKLLTAALCGPERETMDELGRLLLVVDAMALAKSGDLEYEVALPVLKSMRSETAFGPWWGASSALRELELLLWRTEKFELFKKVAQELIIDVFKPFSNLNQVSETMDGLRLQILVTSLACKYQVGDCVQNAMQLFKQWMSGRTNPIPKDLRTAVYCEGVRQGGEEEWQKVWQSYLTSNVVNEKGTFLTALSCSKNENFLNRLLEYSIDASSGIRRQDAPSVFNSVATSSPLGYKVASTFLQNNIKRMHNYLAPDTKDLGRYVQVLANGIVFPEELDQLKRFLAENKKLLEKGELSVKQGVESAENNLIWMSSFYNKISQALTK